MPEDPQTADDAARRRFLTRVLGPHDVVRDTSSSHRASTVVQVRDAGGLGWFVKQHKNPDAYRRELLAYQRWTPALGSRAPSLAGHDDELCAIVLSALPGRLPDGTEPAVHEQAGILLRRLHDAAPPAPWRDFAQAQSEDLERWAPLAAPLLDRRELDFARAAVRTLAQLPAPLRVPCHLDYGPRNWLIDGKTLRLFDFEWCSLDVWVNDLSRLYFGPWRDHSDLRDGFLSGYGRVIDSEDRAVLFACQARRAVWLIPWAREHGQVAFEQENRRILRSLRSGF